MNILKLGEKIIQRKKRKIQDVLKNGYKGKQSLKHQEEPPKNFMSQFFFIFFK